MISVRDGKMGLEFGGRAKMKKSELEEHEPLFYQNYDDYNNDNYNNNNNDDDDDDDDYSTIDPDIALSYIDEKLQDVLGHFQKDFDGVVSAENLGPKFGAYGSFLPSYHRSPVLQRPKTPQNNHISNSSKSLNNRQLECRQTQSTVPSSESLNPSWGSTSSCVARTHLLESIVNDFSKIKEKMSSDQFLEEPSLGYETDRIFPRESGRSLRVRIKVGSDNLSTRKNAEIYSGLGLDISPSISADGSPIDSEVSREPFKPPEESLTSILQIMTSFPVCGTLMLSPLADDLIYLSEKRKVKLESKSRSSQQVSNTKHSNRVKGHKHKSKRKKDTPFESNDHVNKDSQDANVLNLKKGKKVEHPGIGNEVERGCSFDVVKKGSTCDIGSIDFPNGRSGIVFKENANSSKSMLVYPKKDGYRQIEVNGHSTSFQEDCSASLNEKKLKESSSMDGSLVPKVREIENVFFDISKSEVEDSKPQKDLGKVRDTYRDFFGDMELEQDGNYVNSENIISNDKPEDFQTVDNSAAKIVSREISNGKKRKKTSIPGGNSKAAPSENGTISEAFVPVVKEDWVCCDKCQKWRLLPLGTNPDKLPEKWLCTMLDWLPGMNRCSFSEEETTKALVANHQIPFHGTIDQNNANVVKGISDSATENDPVSTSVKRVLAKSSSLNGVNQSPSVNEIGKSKASEKHRHKPKENKKLFDQHAGEFKRKRAVKPGCPSVSKKARVDDLMNGQDRILEKNLQEIDNNLMRDRKMDTNNKSKDRSRNSHVRGTEKKRILCGSDLLEAASENDDRKKKMAGASKIVAKEPKKLKSVLDQQFDPDIGVEYQKRDLGTVQHSQANSSSSKVSGSSKNKIISKEVKGSPVESVSSSPLRLYNHEKIVLRKSLDGEDDSKDEAKRVADNGRKHELRSVAETSSKKLLSHELPLSGKGQTEAKSRLHLVSGAQKEREVISMVTEATVVDDTLKASKFTRKPEKQSGNQLIKSIDLTHNGRKVKDVEPTSPANIAIKEAKDLKHLADRLKNSGSNAESTSLYFQATLKFLYGASLLESINSESAEKGDIIMSMQVYSSTAKLCGFCAHEYEKCKDFAAAALAYKLMEVAYMRVIYSSNNNASRVRHELQSALQLIPLGESPSSSVSEIDNLNNPAIIDKAPLLKHVDSPQVNGENVITARNRPNVSRILDFTQDMNYAMEASKKSRNAFLAATARSKESQGREGIKSVKKAIDFNFHDVERLLRLVRLAMDAISH